MHILLLGIGKTDFPFVREGMDEYSRRLQRYNPCTITFLPDIKNHGSLSHEEIKKREGHILLQELLPTDSIVLLDVKGKHYHSLGFAEFINKKMVAGHKRLVFIIGGAYGFSDEIYARAHDKLSLSAMTFSHQIVRLLFVEQLYRAFTILRNEPYHHE